MLSRHYNLASSVGALAPFRDMLEGRLSCLLPSLISDLQFEIFPGSRWEQGQLIKLLGLEDKLKEFLNTQFWSQFWLPSKFFAIDCLNLALISQPGVIVVLFHVSHGFLICQSCPLDMHQCFPRHFY